MERKQRKAKVEFKDKTLLIDITDYETKRIFQRKRICFLGG